MLKFPDPGMAFQLTLTPMPIALPTAIVQLISAGSLQTITLSCYNAPLNA